MGTYRFRYQLDTVVCSPEVLNKKAVQKIN